MSLNSQKAFGFPFISQPPSLGSFADGAISLASIKAVERMAMFAVSLLRIDIPGASRIALGILGWCQRVQMRWIHAMSTATGVIDDVALWYRSIGQPESHAMGFSRQASEKKDAVAIFIPLARPNEAIAEGFRMRKEPLHFGWRGVMHIVPLLCVWPRWQSWLGV